MKWHFQFTPHDLHDWDSTQVPVLADLTIGGTAAQDDAVRESQRILLRARSHERKDDSREAVRLAELGKGDQPRRAADSQLPGINPSEEGSTKVCPDLGGGTNFFSPSYDPTQRLFFVNARETCAIYYSWHEPFRQGEQYESGGTTRPPDQQNYGALRAIDPLTGDRKWEFRYPVTSSSGILTTGVGSGVLG